MMALTRMDFASHITRRNTATWVSRSYTTAVMFFVLVTTGTSARAQIEVNQQPAPFKLKVDVNHVLVQVIVRDKAGHPIDDLAKDDFQLLDNGKPQSLISVTMERHTDGTVEGTNAILEHQTPLKDQARPSTRFIVFLFDDLHLNSEDMARAQMAGAKVLSDVMAASDLGAVVSITGKTNSGVTRDVTKLKAAIESLRTRTMLKSDASDCPSIDYYEADQIENKHSPVALQDAVRKVVNCNGGMNLPRDQDLAERIADSSAMRTLNMGQLDLQLTYATLGAIVNGMAKLPGERLIIIVSPGFLTLNAESMAAESRIIDTATTSNVMISALDARGLYTTELSASERSPALGGQSLVLNSSMRRNSATQSEDGLSELAAGTGGLFFHNRNDLDAGFKQLAELPECAYVLEFSPEKAKPDGSYHRLKVKVKREGMKIQARDGYFVPKPEKHKK